MILVFRKFLPRRIAIVLGRKDENKVVEFELCNTKFIYTMHARNETNLATLSWGTTDKGAIASSRTINAVQ